MDIFNNSELHTKSRLKRLERGKNLFPAHHNRTKNLMFEINSYKKRLLVADALSKDGITPLTSEEIEKAYNYFLDIVNAKQAKIDAVIQHNLESMQTMPIVIEFFVISLFKIINIMARLFSALSLHALRKQKNINDRVVIAMTEKFTLVQLSSEKISYRHDATQ